MVKGVIYAYRGVYGRCFFLLLKPLNPQPINWADSSPSRLQNSLAISIAAEVRRLS